MPAMHFLSIDHAFLRAFLRRSYAEGWISGHMGFYNKYGSNGSRPGTRFDLELSFFLLPNNGSTKTCIKIMWQGYTPLRPNQKTYIYIYIPYVKSGSIGPTPSLGL
jgi:hypothetical protein